MSASTKKTTKQAAAEVLRREGRPLTTAEIVERVMQTEGIRLSGKTPAASISAQLYVEAKRPNGIFELVGRGTFRLREQ